MNQRRCTICGELVVNASIKGEKHRFHAMLIRALNDIVVPTCNGCKRTYLDKNTATIVDNHLRQIYTAELQRRATALITGLMTLTTQWKLEWLLGLSSGYLSKIKNGKKSPSATLVAALALISIDPQKRMSELEDFWGVGSLDDRYKNMRRTWEEEEGDRNG